MNRGSEIEPLALNVASACEALGVGPATLTRLVREGDLVSFRVGRKRLVEVRSIRDFVARRIVEDRDWA